MQASPLRVFQPADTALTPCARPPPFRYPSRPDTAPRLCRRLPLRVFQPADTALTPCARPPPFRYPSRPDTAPRLCRRLPLRVFQPADTALTPRARPDFRYLTQPDFRIFDRSGFISPLCRREDRRAGRPPLGGGVYIGPRSRRRLRGPGAGIQPAGMLKIIKMYSSSGARSMERPP